MKKIYIIFGVLLLFRIVVNVLADNSEYIHYDKFNQYYDSLLFPILALALFFIGKQFCLDQIYRPVRYLSALGLFYMTFFVIFNDNTTYPCFGIICDLLYHSYESSIIFNLFGLPFFLKIHYYNLLIYLIIVLCLEQTDPFKPISYFHKGLIFIIEYQLYYFVLIYKASPSTIIILFLLQLFLIFRSKNSWLIDKKYHYQTTIIITVIIILKLFIAKSKFGFFYLINPSISYFSYLSIIPPLVLLIIVLIHVFKNNKIESVFIYNIQLFVLLIFNSFLIFITENIFYRYYSENANLLGQGVLGNTNFILFYGFIFGVISHKNIFKNTKTIHLTYE